MKFAQVVGVFPGPKFDDAEGEGVASDVGCFPSVKQMRSPHRCQNSLQGTRSRKVTPSWRLVAEKKTSTGLICGNYFGSLLENIDI